MHAQTPVQIAWVTRDLDATEKALTTMLGAKKWVRVPDVHFTPDTCTYRGGPPISPRTSPSATQGTSSSS